MKHKQDMWTLVMANSREIPNPGNGPITFKFSAKRGGWIPV